MSLVASMIVKNEMGRYLPLAVEHLLTYCDEIRVLDDGSTDGSAEWLEEQDRVEVLRNPGPHFFEHEGQARQNLLDWTLRGRPTWVLSIDADEFCSDPALIKDVTTGREPVLILHMVEAWKVNEEGYSIRVDGHWGPRKVPSLFMAPTSISRGAARGWQIMNRQLACGREPVAVIRASRHAPVIPAEIIHFGWTRLSERQARAQRYFDHDGGQFHKSAHLQSILNTDDQVGLEAHPWPAGLDSVKDRLIAAANDYEVPLVLPGIPVSSWSAEAEDYADQILCLMKEASEAMDEEEYRRFIDELWLSIKTTHAPGAQN